jgi:biotin carboxyl carrier protein
MTKRTFIADLDGAQHTVVVDNRDRHDGTYLMSLDGKDYEIDAHAMPSQIVSMLVGHSSYDVDLERVGDPDDTLDGRIHVRVRGRVVRFAMLDERRHKMKAAAGAHLGGAGSARIESPMPGKVLKLLVKDGDVVKQGQGLVVVEAMKMENELKSPKDGTVVQIACKEGQAVTSGALLVVVE